MENLEKSNILNVLNDEVQIKKKHILGICVGMQILSYKVKGSLKGLGWIPGEVKK